MEKKEQPNHRNVKYGELVEVMNHNGWDSGYHSGMKIHYFNPKGVLLGNIYKFVPYEQIRFRKDSPVWPRHYMDKPLEGIRSFLYETLCRFITVLIRVSYKS